MRKMRKMRKIVLDVSCDGEEDQIEFTVDDNISEEDLEKECDENFNDWLGSTIDYGYHIKSNTIQEEYR